MNSKRNTFVNNGLLGWQITLLSVARCSQQGTAIVISPLIALDEKIKIDQLNASASMHIS